MAFVNELIPESEKEKFTFSVATGHGGYKPTLWKWTIDRSRNVFLVHTHTYGGGYEGTQETQNYVLTWKGNLIYFAADPVLSICTNSDKALSWKIHHLDIPSELQHKVEEVLQLMREAFDAMGLLYKRERVATVDVDFEQSSLR